MAPVVRSCFSSSFRASPPLSVLAESTVPTAAPGPDHAGYRAVVAVVPWVSWLERQRESHGFGPRKEVIRFNSGLLLRLAHIFDGLIEIALLQFKPNARSVLLIRDVCR